MTSKIPIEFRGIWIVWAISPCVPRVSGDSAHGFITPLSRLLLLTILLLLQRTPIRYISIAKGSMSAIIGGCNSNIVPTPEVRLVALLLLLLMRGWW